ncbi:DUF4145 domain-containing protein [Oscillatoriales cyanobacterium LEGE 11467]|uniref:DUF4145 domain-containing protein n=1 Tax=Zarconia navalis LEGE 11467 TaxID=1828826 RepID=A0A928W0N7_9CYAN|nr:DUF4145 domain-containing protein [Zarconia navalis]MBE9041791.1 DUF4145 domain-containing protein [Zarconia navalis LEGE 11467]
MSSKIKVTGLIQCQRCYHQIRMEIVAEYSKTNPQYESGVTWDESDNYELLLCPVCSSVALRSYYWRDYMEPENVKFHYLYPVEQEKPLGLPPEIQKAYDAAIKVKYIDVNAYAVLVGRVLEMICKDRNASGSTLNNKLKNLSAKGEIPNKLVKVSENIRHLRNIGAHASLGELTESEEPLLSSLLRAILEYVYSAPYLAQEAEEKLRILKDSNQ